MEVMGKMKSEHVRGLVSVIIPAFNRVSYLSETIDSVLAQTYKNIELIVVDDGSTDGSYELLQQYQSRKQLTLLKHPNRENKGQAAALNLGLTKASGEFIAVLDSDDLFESDKLALQVNYLQKNTDVGLVYGMGTGIDGQGRYLYDIGDPNFIETNDPNEVLLNCYFLLPQNSLVRRDCYLTAGFFNEDYRAAQDHDMLIRLCEITKIAFMPVKLFKYRRHQGSISANGQFMRWNNGFKILKSAKQRYPYRSSTVRKRKAVLHFRLAQCWSKLRLKGLIPMFYHMALSVLSDPIRACKVLLRVDKSSFTS